MLIFWEQRLAFLATPKAGSTAVEAALESLASAALQRPALLKHTNLRQWQGHVGPWLETSAGEAFTTVALMREPVDWLRSWYRFRLRDDLDDPEHRMEGVSFTEFARRYAAPAGPQALDIGTQSDFLAHGNKRVDHLFRYDRMQDFVAFMEDRIDCVIELPRLNVPPSVKVELSPSDERALRSAMADDIALYQSL